VILDIAWLQHLMGISRGSGRLPPASQNHDRKSDASRAFIDFRAGPIEVCDSRSIAIPAPSPSDGAGFSSRWRAFIVVRRCGAWRGTAHGEA
jgi:hypothetical protein